MNLVNDIVKYLVPTTIVVMLLNVSPVLGVISAMIFSFILIIINPLAFVPLLIIASINHPAWLFGLHLGWWITLAGFCGALFRLVLTDFKAVINLRFVMIMIAFLVLGVIIAFYQQDYRLDRLGMLLILLLFLSNFTAIIYKNHFSNDKLFFLISISGVVVVLDILLMILTGNAFMARSNEVGLSIGEHEGSPSSLSRVISFIFIISVIRLFQIKKNISKESLFLLIMNFLYFLCLLIIGSRMPIIAAAISLFVCLLITVIQKNSKGFPLANLVIIFTLPILLISLMFSSNLVVSGLFGMDNDVGLRVLRSPSIEDNIRLVFWYLHFSSISIFQWIFGSGIAAIHNPHSVFVGVLSTFGILGLFCFALMILSFFIEAFKNNSIIGISLLTYLLMSYSSSSDVDRITFWVLIAITHLIIKFNQFPKYKKKEQSYD